MKLETDRFTLESMSRLEATWRTYAWTFDPEVMHPFGFPSGTWTWRSWYKHFRKFNNRHKFCLAIRPKGARRVIGFESFEAGHSGLAILTVIIGDRNWWGKNVVQETRPAVIDFIFKHVGCGKVWGMPAARNFPSVANYLALGFQCEGVLRKHAFDPVTKEMEDRLAFGLLKREWLERQQTLGARA